MIRVHDINNIYIPPQNVVVEPQNVVVEPQNVVVEPQNVVVESQNVVVESQNAHEFCCDKCNRSFTRKDSLKRHISICKGIIEPFMCIYCNKVLANRCSKSKHQVICKEKNKTQLTTILPNNNTLITSSNIGILNNGTVNNNNINNGTVNNNTINITINNFGKEKLDHVDPAFIERCIRMGNHSGVYEIFRKISLNPNVPENHNVRICDERTQQLCVYKDNEWKLHKKNDILNEIIQVFNDLLINSYNQNEELQKEDIDKHNLKLRCILRDISHKHPIKEHANLCKRLFTSILELGVLQGFRLQMKLVAVNN